MSETAADADEGGALSTSPRWQLVALALGGLILPGVVSYFLDAAGYGILSDFVFVSGYAVAVFLGWYGWIRPLDITGPE